MRKAEKNYRYREYTFTGAGLSTVSERTIITN